MVEADSTWGIEGREISTDQMRQGQTVVGAIVALTLAGALAMQTRGNSTVGRPADELPPLVSILRIESQDWATRDLPLGTMEFDSKQVYDMLRLDGFVYREFKRGNNWFTLYVAYWAPGRVDLYDVQCHVPDNCWTAAGMKITGSEHDLPVGGNRRLAGGERRSFETPDGRNIYAEYVHFSGGTPVRFNRRYSSLGNALKWWWDIFKRPSRDRHEQYFVRIAGNRPLAWLANDATASRLLENVVSRISPGG